MASQYLVLTIDSVGVSWAGTIKTNTDNRCWERLRAFEKHFVTSALFIFHSRVTLWRRSLPVRSYCVDACQTLYWGTL